MLLSDREIIDLCDTDRLNLLTRDKDPVVKPMIAPFERGQVRRGEQGEPLISYGTSSFGYDVRLSNEYKIFRTTHNGVIDPKAFNEALVEEVSEGVCTIPPHGFVLAKTHEHFCIPSNILVVCVGKSTYARCGLIVNVTPLEPGWEGVLTLEISNTTPLPAHVYSFEGIAQLLFLKGATPEVTYRDRGGKYQGQTAVTLPRV